MFVKSSPKSPIASSGSKSGAKVKPSNLQRLKEVNSDSELSSHLILSKDSSTYSGQKCKNQAGSPVVYKRHDESHEFSRSTHGALQWKFEKIISEAKFEAEISLIRCENVLERNRKLEEVFDKMKERLCEISGLLENKPRKQSLFSGAQTAKASLDEKEIKREMRLESSAISSLQADLSKKFSQIADYEHQLNRLERHLSLEKEKNHDLNIRLSQLEMEKDSLYNSSLNLMSPVKSPKNENEVVFSSVDTEPRTPKLFQINRARSTLEKANVKNEDQQLAIKSLLKENEELRRNLDFATLSQESLNGKTRMQGEEIERLRNLYIDKKCEKCMKNAELIARVYRISVKEDSKNRIKVVTDENLEELIINIERAVLQKNKDHLETKARLNKAHDDMEVLVSKIDYDLDFFYKKENELRLKYEKDLSAMKNSLETKKRKKREYKNESKQNLEKALKDQAEIDEIKKKSIGIAEEKKELVEKMGKFMELCKEKTKEIEELNEKLEKDNEEKEELMKKFLEKENELGALKKDLQASKSKELIKETELFSKESQSQNLLNEISGIKIALEDSENKLRQALEAVEQKEAALAEKENQLKVQQIVNQRIKDSIKSVKNEIIDSYEKTLEEKEKIIQDLQDSSDQNNKKLLSASETIKSLTNLLESKDHKLQESIDTEMQAIQSLIKYQNEKLYNKLKLSLEDSSAFSIHLSLFNIQPPDSKDSSLKSQLQTCENLVFTLSNLFDMLKSSYKSSQISLQNSAQEIEKLETAIDQHEKKISFLQNSLKAQEDLKNVVKERYEYQKEILEKYDALLYNQGMRQSDLTSSQEAHLMRINQSIGELKLSLKNKYKQQINSKIADLLAKIGEKEANLSQLKESYIETQRRLKEKEEALEKKVQVIDSKEAEIQNLENYVNDLLETIETYKSQNREDQAIIDEQTKAYMKMENEIEKLKNSEQQLKREKEEILIEKSQAVRNLQDKIEEMALNQEKLDPADDDSLEEDMGADSEKVHRLFADLQEKEAFIKKNNKRIMELQWKNRDLIETIKEYELKMVTHMENAEKLGVDCERLNEELSQANKTAKSAQEEVEILKSQLESAQKDLEKAKESVELGNKMYEAAVEKHKAEKQQDMEEINSLHIEIQEFQGMLKNFSVENSTLIMKNRSITELLQKYKETADALSKENSLLEPEVRKFSSALMKKDEILKAEMEKFEFYRQAAEKTKENLEEQIKIMAERLLSEIEKPEDQAETAVSRRVSELSTRSLLSKDETIEALQKELEEKDKDIKYYTALYNNSNKEFNQHLADCSLKEQLFNEKVSKCNQELLAAKNQSREIKKQSKEMKKEISELQAIKGQLENELKVRDEESKKSVQESIEKVGKEKIQEKREDKRCGENGKIEELREKLREKKGKVQELKMKIKMIEEQNEEIVQNLKKELELLNGSPKSNSRSIWMHVDQLNKQLEEKNKL